MSRKALARLAALIAPLVLVGGCPGVSIDLGDGATLTIPGLKPRVVVLQVLNDSDFEVAPHIRFGAGTGFWDRLVGSTDELAPNILAPGEYIEYDMDCDELGTVYSDRASQFFLTINIGQADETRVLERDDDFECGDTILFEFVGNNDAFGVIVSINGVVVD